MDVNILWTDPGTIGSLSTCKNISASNGKGEGDFASYSSCSQVASTTKIQSISASIMLLRFKLVVVLLHHLGRAFVFLLAAAGLSVLTFSYSQAAGGSTSNHHQWWVAGGADQFVHHIIFIFGGISISTQHATGGQWCMMMMMMTTRGLREESCHGDPTMLGKNGWS